MGKVANFPGTLGVIDQVLDTNFNSALSPVLDVSAYIPDLDGIMNTKQQLEAGKKALDLVSSGKPLTDDQLEKAISAAGSVASLVPTYDIARLGVSGPMAARVTNAVVNSLRGYRSSDGTKFPTNWTTELSASMVGGSGKGGHLSELNQSNAKDALGTLKSDFWNEYTAAVNEGRSLDAGLVKQVKEFKKFAPQLYPDMSPELATKKYVVSLLREPQNFLN